MPHVMWYKGSLRKEQNNGSIGSDPHEKKYQEV